MNRGGVLLRSLKPRLRKLTEGLYLNSCKPCPYNDENLAHGLLQFLSGILHHLTLYTYICIASRLIDYSIIISPSLFTANCSSHLRCTEAALNSRNLPIPPVLAPVQLRTLAYLTLVHARHMTTDVWDPGNSPPGSSTQGTTLGGKGGRNRDGQGQLVCPKCGEPFKAIASIMSE